MLPLWIIDITTKSARRDAFQRLVGQIDHVHMPVVSEPVPSEHNGEIQSVANDKNEIDVKILNDNSSDSEQSVKKKIEEEEIRKAAKRAKLRGDYWYYSQIDDILTGNVDFTPDGANSNAELLYAFQENLVAEAKKFVMSLRQSNARPYQTINVAVLGDATQMFTRFVFASIAIILQKEKGRYLANHIHQGMDFVGFLYIPCEVNSFDVEDRLSIFHLFKEIEVQHQTTGVRGYDNMVIYQNVQNRTECSYPMLNEEQQAEYLLQCLVHLYLACDDNHPLISGTGSDDSFYLSMGAASLYFDMAAEDEKDTFKVINDLFDVFKGQNLGPDASDVNLNIIDPEIYSAETTVKTFLSFINTNIDLDGVDIADPSPHPIVNALQKNLKRLYYNYYLRFYPAALMRNITAQVEETTREQLNNISNKSDEAFESSIISINPGIERVISKVTERCGSLSYIEYSFKNLQELLSKERELVRENLQKYFWNPLLTDKIDEDKQDPFEEYHNAYINDSANKNNGAGCKLLKEEIQQKLQSLLGNEKTFVATVVRCFFLGLLCVLTILPILHLISPMIVDLGNVRKNAHFWAFGIFLIPSLVQYICYLLYLRKRSKYLLVLKAYYIHDAYARLANRIEAETGEYYDKMMSLCKEYLNRCLQIRKIRIPEPSYNVKMAFPSTMFNQPLNGGSFDGEEIIPENEVEESRIRINFEPRGIGHLSTNHYYLLINQFREDFASLFANVSIPNLHARYYDEDLGKSIFISREEQLKNSENLWSQQQKSFIDHLFKDVRKEMVPREYPTIGDKILQYYRKSDQLTLLEPLCQFAATNGEMICDANIEYADVKINKDISELTAPYLPIYTCKNQISEFTDLYKKFVFVTRWHAFSHFSFNRFFPTEDFDCEIREIMVATEEKRKKEKEKREDARRYGHAIEEKPLTPEEEKPYVPILSSLLLWAVCPDEKSSIWMQLFDKFDDAYKDRNIYRDVLNQEN